MARLHPFSSLVNFLYSGNSQGQSELRCEFGRQKLARAIWKEALRRSLMCLFPVRLIYFLMQEQRTRQNSGNY